MRSSLSNAVGTVGRRARRHWRSTGLASALLVLTGAIGLAAGAIPDSTDGVIHACYQTSPGNGPPQGTLRVIDAQAGEACAAGETALSWNQTGPTGQTGPQGVQGLQGSTGPTGPRGEIGPQGSRGRTGPRGPAGNGRQGPRGPAGTGGVYEAGGSYANPADAIPIRGNEMALDVPAGTYAVNAVAYVFSEIHNEQPICQLIQMTKNKENGGNTGGVGLNGEDEAIPIQDTFTFKAQGKILLRCNDARLAMLANSTIQAINVG